MKKVILLGLMLVSFVGYSQVIENEDSRLVTYPYTPHEQRDEKEFDENHIYVAVEKMPEYPKGIEEFRKFIAENFRNPKVDKDLKGIVIVQFVVEKDGSLSDIKVLRDLGYGTGKEAIRVLKKSKKWEAGVQNGKKVRVRYLLPVQVDVKANQE